MAASLNSQATALPDEYQESLNSAINKLRAPGPNIAGRLVDILELDTAIATESELIADSLRTRSGHMISKSSVRSHGTNIALLGPKPFTLSHHKRELKLDAIRII